MASADIHHCIGYFRAGRWVIVSVEGNLFLHKLGEGYEFERLDKLTLLLGHHVRTWHRITNLLLLLFLVVTCIISLTIGRSMIVLMCKV